MVSVYPKGASPTPEPPALEIREDIRIYHLSHVATDIRSALRFVKCLQEIPTDIYLKMFTEPSTILLAAYAKLKRIPYVLFMAHDNHCRKDAGLDVAARYSVSWYTRFLMIQAGLYSWSLRGANKMLVQNVKQKDLLKENFNIEADDIIKVGHPVPVATSLLPKKKQVIWNARFVAWKRLELFLEIAKQLPEYDFVIGGPTPSEAASNYFQEIASQTASIPNVHIGTFPETFEDFLSFPLYSEASLFVDTVEQGGFENTLVQAWLRGIPVVSISRSFDGVLEKEGLGVYCHGRIEEAVAAIRKLFSHPNELKALSESSRAFAVKEYDIKLITKTITSHLQVATQKIH